jgi:hypothetical protein
VNLNQAVIVKLSSGLGNQLFQLANGLEQSLRLSAPLICDTSNSISGLDRPYALQQLEDILNFSSAPLPEEILLAANISEYTENKEFIWDEGVNQIETGVYISGYFQHPSYHKTSLSKLLGSLNKIREQRKRIDDNSSVNIHFRRGDYESNPIIRTKLGLLSLDYYINAIKEIERSSAPIRNLHVFSDSPKKAHEIFSKVFYNKNIIIHSSVGDPLLDLLDLSVGSSLIAANSTFSWWAANLLKFNNPDADIIFPATMLKQIPSAQVLLKDGWTAIKSTWA